MKGGEYGFRRRFASYSKGKTGSQAQEDKIYQPNREEISFPFQKARCLLLSARANSARIHHGTCRKSKQPPMLWRVA
ncbi:MAG: hypothetical protein ACLSCV_07130 [Acutalibacteraceae bacterium]